MRPVFFTTCLAVLSTVSASPASIRSRDVVVLGNAETVPDYDPASLLLAIPCADRACATDDDGLVVNINLDSSSSFSQTFLVFDKHKVNIPWTENRRPESKDRFSLSRLPTGPSINLSWTGELGAPDSDGRLYQLLHFSVTLSWPVEIDSEQEPVRYSDFTLLLRPDLNRPSLELMGSPQPPVGYDIDSEYFPHDSSDLDHGFPSQNPPEYDSIVSSSDSPKVDLAGELESLRLLENQAKLLEAQIAAKKQAISQNVRQHRDKLCLKQLLKECDGIVCAAKVIAQKICDKLGIETEYSFGHNQINSPHIEHMIALQDENHREHMLVNGAINRHVVHHTADPPNSQTAYRDPQPIHRYQRINSRKSRNPVLEALSILAGVLGLSALFLFVRSRCMSMRKRVERAADREQRRNERAYRRAARRALIRHRWDAFLNTFSCFRAAPCPRHRDYEEKRALILQDAFLEQDVDQMEKGEVMEAEIRELRYAHEIVSSLVRVDEQHNRYELRLPVRDLPPSLVPLPQIPTSRSRAASTGTLPSYSSESLPDYSSRPERDDTPSSPSAASASISDFPDDKKEISNSPSSVSSHITSNSDTNPSRYTPNSSVRAVSPRPSSETLRTRQSKDAA